MKKIALAFLFAGCVFANDQKLKQDVNDAGFLAVTASASAIVGGVILASAETKQGQNVGFGLLIASGLFQLWSNITLKNSGN